MFLGFLLLLMAEIGDVVFLGTAGSVRESPDAVAADIEPLVPPGTGRRSISMISVFWVLGKLEVVATDDVDLLVADKNVSG
jgi:hypothetical protein